MCTLHDVYAKKSLIHRFTALFQRCEDLLKLLSVILVSKESFFILSFRIRQEVEFDDIKLHACMHVSTKETQSQLSEQDTE